MEAVVRPTYVALHAKKKHISLYVFKQCQHNEINVCADQENAWKYKKCIIKARDNEENKTNDMQTTEGVVGLRRLLNWQSYHVSQRNNAKVLFELSTLWCFQSLSGILLGMAVLQNRKDHRSSWTVARSLANHAPHHVENMGEPWSLNAHQLSRHTIHWSNTTYYHNTRVIDQQITRPS